MKLLLTLALSWSVSLRGSDLRCFLTGFQELMSEESIHLSSQQVSGTPDRTRESCRSAGEASKSKPRFAEFACSHVEVIDINRVLYPQIR